MILIDRLIDLAFTIREFLGLFLLASSQPYAHEDMDTGSRPETA